MKVFNGSPTPGVVKYIASSGHSICRAHASDSPPHCLLFGLASGAQHKVETVACLENNDCSVAFVAYGYTIPQSKF